MQRLRGRGTFLLGSMAPRMLKKKALNSWAAVQDTIFSTKDIFERHKVVFTIGTSIASVATAWAGYGMRHWHDSKVDQRLESIEQAMKNNYEIGHAEFKKLVNPGSFNLAAYMATAGTTFVFGYGFGWRGGRWYANRKHRKEQMKLLGHMKPKRWQSLGRIKPREWQFNFLRRRLIRPKSPETVVKEPKKMLKSAPTTLTNPGQLCRSESC